MGHQSSSYRIAGIAIVICLVAAGFITFFSNFTPGQTGVDQSRKTVTGIHGDDTKVSVTNQTTTETSKIRVLWYDDAGKTYTFRDYDRKEHLDSQTWMVSDLPPPENGTLQKKPAMVRFLEWDGNIERMTDTKYLIDQDTITNILNSYTLIAPPPPVTPGTKPDAPSEISPTPEVTPAPGMLIPSRGQPCNRGDGTIQVTFGYTSRHNTPVSLPVGDKNEFSPGDPSRGQPVIFMPGVHTDAFTVIFPSNGSNVVWNLMGTNVGAGEVPRLQAMFTAEPQRGYAPLDVRLTDQSIGSTPENPLVGVWDLGTGMSARGDSLTNRYEKSGEYQVKRTVSTACGSTTVVKTISIFETSFSTIPVPGSPATFQLEDQSTGNPTVWFWDFNDGFSSWEQNPVHTWTAPGTYAVQLTVSGKSGTGTIVKKVIIS